MNTETRRAASRAYHAAREAKGLKKVTVWLSEEARDALAKQAQALGSKDKAVEKAIMTLGLGEGHSAKPIVGRNKIVAVASAPVTYGDVVDHGNGVVSQKVTFGPVRADPGARLKKPKR